MKEWYGDMFNWFSIPKRTVMCVTTNGYVKSNGECVMGRGIAKAISNKFPDVPKILGSRIKESGNIIHQLKQHGNVLIVSFPVKHEEAVITDLNMVVPHKRNDYVIGQICPGFALVADPLLIKRSVLNLVTIMDNMPDYEFCALPRPGSGAGCLDWETQVKPILEPLLDDRFYVCHWKRGE